MAGDGPAGLTARAPAAAVDADGPGHRQEAAAHAAAPRRTEGEPGRRSSTPARGPARESAGNAHRVLGTPRRLLSHVAPETCASALSPQPNDVEGLVPIEVLLSADDSPFAEEPEMHPGGSADRCGSHGCAESQALFPVHEFRRRLPRRGHPTRRPFPPPTSSSREPGSTSNRRSRGPERPSPPPAQNRPAKGPNSLVCAPGGGSGDGGNRTHVRSRAAGSVYERSRRSDLVPRSPRRRGSGEPALCAVPGSARADLTG